VQLRNLGALLVAVNGVEQPVTGSKAPAILALLVINANHRVSVESLMDAAWGGRVTSGTVSTLESHIWRLRKLLEPGRGARQASSILVNEAGGYRFASAGRSIDSLLFEEIAGDMRDLLAAGDPAAAATRADEALALWRGQPYGTLSEQDWARPAVARLHEVRSQVVERRIDAWIATGSLDRALADLETLIAATPFRERLWAQQMVALYRSNRTEQALNSFRQARACLVGELGTEPGSELQDLYRRMLDNDPELMAEPSVPARLRPGPVEVQLPATRTRLRGRQVDRDQVSDLVATRGMVTIVGAAGCGKTRLAIEVGRHTARKFSDGVWFVDLGVIEDPKLVVDVITSTIGFAGSPGATALEDLTYFVRGRRMLLILDNCEHLLAAVGHLAEVVLGQSDDSPSFSILATSREPINIEGETLWPLRPLELPAPAIVSGIATPPDQYESPAVQLFLDRLASAAPTLEINATIVNQVAAICAAVDGLPLAIELAAARARSYTLDDILTQVATDPSGLRRIGRGPTDHRTTLRTSIEWSHRMLTPPEQLAHRRFAVLPGTFTRALADDILPETPPDDVGDLLAQLVHRSMLTSTASQRSGRPTVFSQLATVRSHARYCLTKADELDLATLHRNRWTAKLLAARPRLGSPAEAGWYHEIDDNYPTVRAVLSDLLIDHHDTTGAKLAPRLAFYWYYRAKMQEAARWLQLAHSMLQHERTVDAAMARLTLGAALAVQGRIDLARPYIRHTMRLLPTIPPDRLIEVGEGLVGVAAAVWVRDAFDLVEQVYDALADVAERADDDHLQLLTDAVGSVAIAAAGRLDEAAATGADVYHRSAIAGNTTACWIAAGPPMIAALVATRPDEGIPWVERVMQGHLSVQSAAGGMFIETRANFAAQSGDYLQAVRLYGAARTQTRRAAMVWPRRSITRQLLQQTRSQLSADDYEHAWREGEHLSLEEISRAPGQTRDP
jgi:predicted ATPase/DNA-binding SARP family transcriptional activator